MATILASKIVEDARTLLQDPTGVRWPDDEMLSWLSAAQREIVALRPDTNAKTIVFAPVSGSVQVIPTDGHAFVDAPSNTAAGAARRAITVVPRHLLDSQVPNWRGATASSTALHVVFDPRTPKRFLLYPPAIAGASSIELVYAVSPAEITSLAQVISIDDIYANPIIDYVCYRAYSKDMADVGNAERAIAHRQAFENTLGLQAKADMARNPIERVKG